MSEPTSISVFIITLNEGERLADTIRAVQPIADEIVIVDSGSTDQTCQIARQLGARVIHNEFEGYGQQKVFAEEQCQNSWLLSLDADEVVTPQLRQELLEWKSDASRQEFAGYRIDILTVYHGETKPRWLARDYRLVRLYNKDRIRYRAHPLFDRVQVGKSDPLGILSGPIYHFSIVTYEQMIAKANRLSDLQALRMPPRNLGILKLRVWFEFPFCFLKAYFLRRHITGGWKGYLYSVNQAFFRTIRIAKILERMEQDKRSD